MWDYDSFGRLIKYTNAMGEETEYFYENSIYPGNITKTTMADPSNTHYVLGSQTAQTIYTYDQYNAFVASEARSYQGGTSITLYEYEYLFGNIEKQINPDNDWWAFEYDEKGRLLSEYSPIVQGDGYIFYFVTDYAYPGLFFDPSYTIDPTRVFDVVVKNEYVYNITSGTYSSKSASQYLYGSEGEGLLLRQFDFDRPAGDGYEPIITQYRYDNYTRLTEVIDDAGKSTKAKYDAFGRVEEITDNAGSKYVTEYNPTARNQLSYFVPVSAPATKENHIKLQFDAFGNLTTKYAYPNGYNETPISAEYRYNIAGKITGYTDSNVNEYSYEYDKTGRLAKTVFPDGTSTAASYNKFGSPNFEHQYDEDGNVAASRATVIDEAGNKRFTFYQYNNLLINSDAYQSDAMGRIIDKNEGGATYTMQYDGMSNITKLTSGDTSINYRYGRHGITKIVPADSSVTAIQYAYNNFGRLYGKAQDDVSMMYQYTTTGQVEVSWDSLGMITEYYYDNLNRVNSVYALNSDYVFDYYDDGMVKTVYSGPLTTTYTYDNLNRTTSIITKRGTTTINNLAYTYDNNSNILTETRNGVTSTYTYDGLNRLKTVNYGDGNTITYYYDARGNHERESHSNGSEKVFGYDKSNRLISVAENGIITDEYEYNAAGAVISHNNDTYTYDNWDRLASATINGTAYTYKYDGNGLRTAKNDKKYIVDINGNVVAERNGSTTTAQNVYINGQIMSRKIGGNWYFYLKNAHGDVIGMADSNGNIVNTYTYDAWGNIRSTGTVETVENPIKYAGEYTDLSSGLIYLRNRYYDPQVGRFISEDPIRSGMNWYVYANNNPVNYIDPLGLDAIWITTSEDSVYGMGHSSIIVEDTRSGAWYYFYWGDKATYFVEVPKESLSTLEAFNEWNTGMGLRANSTGYTTGTYIEGDFNASVDHFRNLIDNTEVSHEVKEVKEGPIWNRKVVGYEDVYKNESYNAWSRNCMHESLSGFNEGTLRNGTNAGDFLGSIGSKFPNDARRVFNWTFFNQRFTKDMARNDVEWEAKYGTPDKEKYAKKGRQYAKMIGVN